MGKTPTLLGLAMAALLIAGCGAPGSHPRPSTESARSTPAAPSSSTAAGDGTTQRPTARDVRRQLAESDEFDCPGWQKIADNNAGSVFGCGPNGARIVVAASDSHRFLQAWLYNLQGQAMAGDAVMYGLVTEHVAVLAKDKDDIVQAQQLLHLDGEKRILLRATSTIACQTRDPQQWTAVMLAPQGITSVARRLGTSPENIRNGQAGQVYCHPSVTGANVLDNGVIVTVSNPPRHAGKRCLAGELVFEPGTTIPENIREQSFNHLGVICPSADNAPDG